MKYNTIDFNISNTVSEPLLWPFLSSLVFIGVTPFPTSLSPSQQLSQPLAIEPSMSSSHHPWVLDLQPPSLRSFTLQRPLPFASPLQILLQLRFWRYHWDRLALIYTLGEASKPSETACSPVPLKGSVSQLTCLHAPLHVWVVSPRTASSSHAPSRASTLLLTSFCHVSPSCVIVDVTCLRQPLTSSFYFWMFDCWLLSRFNRWLSKGWPLTFSQSWLFAVQCPLPSFSRRFHFYSPFLHILLLNEK